MTYGVTASRVSFSSERCLHVSKPTSSGPETLKNSRLRWKMPAQAPFIHHLRLGHASYVIKCLTPA